MGPFHWLGKKRWRSALQGDELVEVGTAYMAFQPPAGDERASRVAVIVGRNRLAFALWDFKDSPVNTILVERADLGLSMNMRGNLVIDSAGGWRYELGQIRDRTKVLNALGLSP